MTDSQDIPITMRAFCPKCDHPQGLIRTRGSQDCVRCARCDHYCYNAPRVETGRETRSLRTRPDITVTQRARILARDNSSCIICHRHDVALDVGHLLSVKEGRNLGLSDRDLYNDENLAAMCAPCNSGLGDALLPLRILVPILQSRLTNKPDTPNGGLW